MLSRKTSRSSGVPSVHEIPAPPPGVPSSVVQRFPEMAGYSEQLSADREALKRVILRAVEHHQARIDELDVQIQAQRDSLASLQDAVDGLDVAVAVEPTPDNSAQVNDLAALLDDHIEAKTAHGVSGSVVGTNGHQDLNDKDIGRNIPGYGRFKSVITAGRIRSGETLTVPMGDVAVFGTPFTFDGNLVVEGGVHFV